MRNPSDDAGEVLGSLFRRHHLHLVRTALLIVGDRATAEDVVQEAFARVHRRLPELSDRDDLLPYLRTAVVNGCRSVLRRRRLRLRPAHDPSVWSAEAAAIVAEEHREVHAALSGLPARQREALVLRYYLDLTEAEIAEAMGISAGTVKSTTSRALAALARTLGGKA
ncbi:RNA polymerase sigma factor [Actinomadura gamaensis]|uniref:RNA polymerase sigma factor n=1 Tax=Actinomadura gamaensis TaxID=1763541 RepID=A0ABV9TV26_9ACTN